MIKFTLEKKSFSVNKWHSAVKQFSLLYFSEKNLMKSKTALNSICLYVTLLTKMLY